MKTDVYKRQTLRKTLGSMINDNPIVEEHSFRAPGIGMVIALLVGLVCTLSAIPVVLTYAFFPELIMNLVGQ